MAETEVLNQYSYVNVDDFFEAGENHFQIFSDKQVSSVRELKLQDRTIWFVRSARKSDRATEIELYGAGKTEFSPYNLQPIGRNREALLWLCDLHFGSLHGFPTKREGNRNPLWLVLERLLRALNLEVAGLLVSGDITSKCECQGFEEAHNFLIELMSKLRLDTPQVQICPGNHDFDLDHEQLDEGTEPASVTASNATGFSNFWTRLFQSSPDHYLSSARKFLLSGAVAVDVVALNSVALQQHHGQFQGFGFVGTAQLDHVWKMYNEQAAVRRGLKPFQILMMHHHVVPVTYSEPSAIGSRYSLTLDAEAVFRWALERGFHALLHGHMHQPSAVHVRRPANLLSAEGTVGRSQSWPSLAVLGLGSSGTNRAEQGRHGKNVIGLITAHHDHLTVSYYDIDPTEMTKAPEPITEIEIARG